MFRKETGKGGNFDNTVIDGMNLVSAEVLESAKTPGLWYMRCKFKKTLPSGNDLTKSAAIFIPGKNSPEFAQTPKKIEYFLAHLDLLSDAIGDGESFTTKEDYMNQSLENMKPLAEKFAARMNCFPDVEYKLFGHYKHMTIDDDDIVVFDSTDQNAVYNGKPTVVFSGDFWQPSDCTKRPYLSADKVRVIELVNEGKYRIEGLSSEESTTGESDDLPF